jgi:hypothetical protein
VVLGRVSMPLPKNERIACVWFIGIKFPGGERSW